VQTTLLLLPDFLLVASGFVLCRCTALARPVWDGVERLVYYVLFPVLLFTSIQRTPLQPMATLGLAAGAVAVVLAGIALAYSLKRLPDIDARLHASGAQAAFRFNTFIALATAERLAGAQGLALIALVVALAVPLCNLGAVWPLARHGGQHVGRELLRNPLIAGTAAGLAANLAGLPLPEPVSATLQRIGAAALPLGLMAAGAGLRFGSLALAPRLSAGLLGIRHVVLPLLALGLALALHLPPLQAQVLVAFAAMPTASAAYVLAVRMGGHGPFVAGLVTLSMLLSMVTLPLWLAVQQAVQRGP
jgi:malonate transporter and related proteins